MDIRVFPVSERAFWGMTTHDGTVGPRTVKATTLCYLIGQKSMDFPGISDYLVNRNVLYLSHGPWDLAETSFGDAMYKMWKNYFRKSCRKKGINESTPLL